MTFTEVIMVLVIIGILTAIVMPKTNIGITSSRASVGGAAYTIVSDIRYAQESAIANRIYKNLNFTATSSVYTFSPTHPMDPSGRLPSGVTINKNYTITFNSLGAIRLVGDCRAVNERPRLTG